MFGVRVENISSNAAETVRSACLVFDRLGKRASADHAYTGEYTGKAVVVRSEISHVGEIGSEEIVFRRGNFFAAGLCNAYASWVSNHLLVALIGDPLYRAKALIPPPS
jgi:hypothetical protein